jgi:hypothetical protein
MLLGKGQYCRAECHGPEPIKSGLQASARVTTLTHVSAFEAMIDHTESALGSGRLRRLKRS